MSGHTEDENNVSNDKIILDTGSTTLANDNQNDECNCNGSSINSDNSALPSNTCEGDTVVNTSQEDKIEEIHQPTVVDTETAGAAATQEKDVSLPIIVNGTQEDVDCTPLSKSSSNDSMKNGTSTVLTESCTPTTSLYLDSSALSALNSPMSLSSSVSVGDLGRERRKATTAHNRHSRALSVTTSLSTCTDNVTSDGFSDTEEPQLCVNSFGEIVDKESLTLSEEQIKNMKKYVQKEAERSKKWVKMFARWDSYSKRYPEKIKARVRKGIPDRVRGKAWQLIIGSPELLQKNPGVYEKLVATGVTNYDDVIRRDLNRTLPQHVMFREADGAGQKSLYNVLKAFACYDETVGYCQGMGFIIAVCLTYMTEEETFWLIVKLMKDPRWSLGSVFQSGFGAVKQYFFVLEKLIHDHVPKLEKTLLKNEVDVSFFASEWFLTLFAYNFSFDKILRIWDIFFYEGWKIIFRIGLAMLKSHQNAMIDSPFESLMKHLKDEIYLGFTPGSLIKAALKINLYSKHMDRYMQLYKNQNSDTNRKGKKTIQKH